MIAESMCGERNIDATNWKFTKLQEGWGVLSFTGSRHLGNPFQATEELSRIAMEGAVTPVSFAQSKIEMSIDPLLDFRFDPDAAPPELKVVISLNGTCVATPGNLIALSGPAKSGKSHGLGALMAACMAENPSECDLLGFIAPNPEAKALIYLDAEQSPYHFHNLIRCSLKRGKAERPPAWFHAYNLTGKSPEEIVMAAYDLCDYAIFRHGGVHLLILDGFADLMVSPNDEGESFELVRKLHSLAGEINAPIVGVLHHNAGNEGGKMRGHLGSQIERKAETVLTCKRDGEGVVIYTTQSRNAPVFEKDGPRFAWDNDEGMFLSTESKAEIHSKTKHGDLLEKTIQLAQGECDKAWRWNELRDAYIDLFGKSESTAKRFIDEAKGSGLVILYKATGYYYLGPEVKQAIEASKQGNQGDLGPWVQTGFKQGS